jgi:single-stranded-DNA-specific exonuclease
LKGFPLKLWQKVPADAGASKRLAQAQQLPLPLATLLVSRGYEDTEETSRFLNPRLSDLSDPFLLPDAEVAGKRLWLAIERQERVCVFGDYDVDGVSSSALLVNVFRELGLAVETFVPNRLEEGYGLSAAALARCLETNKPDVLITVDCGTSSVDEVKAARDAGVDVIVTDHHEAPDGVADALAVVNPKLGDFEPAKTLAGVGVAFKLCHAMVKIGLQEKREAVTKTDLRRHLDLVAIGTIADIVPLVGENRILAKHGLMRLNRYPRLGLSELLRVAGVQEDLDAYHIGFVIGPRLNAAGRLGDARRALDILLVEEPAGARKAAEVLDAANQERKAIEQAIQIDARKRIDSSFDPEKSFGLVVGDAGWHQGTVGIVASRLCSRYYRPSIVIGFDETGLGRGSCRSIADFDMLAALDVCKAHLVTFGGHTMAAGVTIKSENLAAFAEQFNVVCAGMLEGRDLRPVQRVDAWVQFGEVDASLLEAMSSLHPFGMGHPTPVWGARGVSLAGPARKVGKEGRHLKLRLAQGGSVHEAVAFNQGAYPIPEGKIDVVFQVRANTFRGGDAVELHVQDIRPSTDT